MIVFKASNNKKNGCLDSLVLPVLFSKLRTQTSAVNHDVDTNLLRRLAVNSTGFWPWISTLPVLHLLPDPLHGEKREDNPTQGLVVQFYFSINENVNAYDTIQDAAKVSLLLC